MSNNLNLTDFIGSNVSIQVKIEDLQDFAKQILLGAQCIVREQIKAAARADKLLTVEEAAQMLSVSKMTLYRWDQNGILKKVEIGGKRRYRLSDIEKLVGCKM